MPSPRKLSDVSLIIMTGIASVLVAMMWLMNAGSSCFVNAYTSNHDVIADPKTGALKGFLLHAVDATGLVHALLLRIQALLLPVKTLVLSGH